MSSKNNIKGIVKFIWYMVIKDNHHKFRRGTGQIFNISMILSNKMLPNVSITVSTPVKRLILFPIKINRTWKYRLRSKTGRMIVSSVVQYHNSIYNDVACDLILCLFLWLKIYIPRQKIFQKGFNATGH